MQVSIGYQLRSPDTIISHHPQMRRGNAFGRICLSVCPVRALIFESLDLEI